MEMQATLHGLKVKGRSKQDKIDYKIDDKSAKVFDKLLEGEKDGKRRPDHGWRRF